MSQTLKPKKKVWTPPPKSEHKQKTQKIAAMGSLSSLAKFVGTNAKPKARRSSVPKGEIYEAYAQGKTPNPELKWQSKDGPVMIGTLTNEHLVGILGYLYWGNAKHGWLLNNDRSKVYTQVNMDFEGGFVRDAFDAVVVELVKERKHFLEKEQIKRVAKIVKHVVVLRTQLKKREAKKQKQQKAQP